jgi:epoxyqueuosine reductase QueG
MDRHKLEQLARTWGGDFFGVADLAPFQNTQTIPGDLTGPYLKAISVGVALSRDVFENLIDGPNPHYSHHYATVNVLLDQLAVRLAGAIQKIGHRALPIPASQILDDHDWRGAISHKAVARMAGLGWQGKSLLLINPQVGPRIRLVSILTDLDLEADQPLPNRCGHCNACTEACPAGAITGRHFGQGYTSRSEAWNAQSCTDKLINDFAHRPGVAPLICGLCIKACPVGRKPKKY